MREREEGERLRRLADEAGDRSWADLGSCGPRHELLRPYIAGYTYAVGSLREPQAKFITRAYPTVMTHLYVELCGGLSEVKDGRGVFPFGNRRDAVDTTIRKRTYVKQGLGSWFDIHQLPSRRETRPIRNLKVDLHPSALYRLFGLSPPELAAEDLQLADLIGATSAGLMLEEMEAAVAGTELPDIVERYFLEHLMKVGIEPPRDLRTVPDLPCVEGTLALQARRYHKSERWLQKRYAEVYGMSFKRMQRNLKFHDAHRTLSRAIERHRPLSLTDLAHRAGYFDQSHFIKDFRHYTGMTPGRYLHTRAGPDGGELFYW